MERQDLAELVALAVHDPHKLDRERTAAIEAAGRQEAVEETLKRGRRMADEINEGGVFDDLTYLEQ